MLATVEDAIYIEAPPDVVWAVTEDVERWPEWTPTVTSVLRVDDGPIGLGSAARIKQPGQREAKWTVTEFAPQRRFVWGTRRPGMRMRASHEMEPDGTGTANVLRVEVAGVVAMLLWPVLRSMVRRSLSSENQGLKARCEAVLARRTNS